MDEFFLTLLPGPKFQDILILEYPHENLVGWIVHLHLLEQLPDVIEALCPRSLDSRSVLLRPSGYKT